MSFGAFKIGLKAQVAAWRHGRPAKKLKVILVTGQDGAVGTATFLASILEAAGERVGVVTSQFVQIAGELARGSDQADPTGDPYRLQALLAQMKRASCTYALVEVPAQLPAHQFEAISPKMIIIRRCVDNYVDHSGKAANLAILHRLLGHRPEYVVYNSDDSAADDLLWLRGQDGAISFGSHKRAECQIQQVRMHRLGSQVALTIDHQTPLTLETNQPGKQAVYNMAAAAAAAYVLHMPVEAIEQGCRTAGTLGGALQAIPIARSYQIMLDTAVTPAGLAESIEAAKHFSKNRLIMVYGPPLLAKPNWLPRVGELLAQADRLFITEGEFVSQQSPKQLDDLLWQGVNAVGGEAKAETLFDRQAAIEKAVSIARRGDVVLVSSNTRPYRQLGDEHRPWSDQAVINELFAA